MKGLKAYKICSILNILKNLYERKSRQYQAARNTDSRLVFYVFLPQEGILTEWLPGYFIGAVFFKRPFSRNIGRPGYNFPEVGKLYPSLFMPLTACGGEGV